MIDLSPIKATRKTGEEVFTGLGKGEDPAFRQIQPGEEIDRDKVYHKQYGQDQDNKNSRAQPLSELISQR